MTKAKKTKKVSQRPTELDRIVKQLRTALRNQTKNVIEIGKLLIESRKHLEHGDWQAWLAENFDLSIRTAQRYVAAAEYVARKSDTVSDFANLSPSVLYVLAEEGNYSEQEEAAILAATREGRVDTTRAETICEALAPPDDADDADDQEDGDEDGRDSGDEKDAESEAILDGPSPAVPPPAPNPPPTDFALRDFDQAIGTLKRLMTKSSEQFVRTSHTIDDLGNVESFLRAVMISSKKAHEAPPVPDQQEPSR